MGFFTDDDIPLESKQKVCNILTWNTERKKTAKNHFNSSQSKSSINLFSRTPPFSHRQALFTQGAFIRLVGLYVHVQEGGAGDIAKISLAAAAVYEHADGHGYAAVGFDYFDDFFYGAAGSYNVLHNQAALSFMQGKAPAEGHFAIDAFGKDGSGA